MTDVIAQGQREGTFRDVDPLLAHLSIMPPGPHLLRSPARARGPKAARRFRRAARSSTSSFAICRPPQEACFGKHHDLQRESVSHDAARSTLCSESSAGVRCRRSVWRPARQRRPPIGFASPGTSRRRRFRPPPKWAAASLELRVAEGDRIEAGAIIARLDTEDTALQIARTRADRAAAVAQLRLLEAGSREEDIRQARAQVDAATADAAAIDAEVKASRARPRSIPGAPHGQRRIRQAARRCAGASRHGDRAPAGGAGPRAVRSRDPGAFRSRDTPGRDSGRARTCRGR